MSVETEADTRRDTAKAALDVAIKHLSEIVVQRCCGYEEFTDTYRATLRNTLSDLIELREKL